MGFCSDFVDERDLVALDLRGPRTNLVRRGPVEKKGFDRDTPAQSADRLEGTGSEARHPEQLVLVERLQVRSVCLRLRPRAFSGHQVSGRSIGGFARQLT